MPCLPSRRGFTLVEALILIALVVILLGFALTGVAKVREAAARMTSSNYLRQQALGCHNYHDTFNKFPTFDGVTSVHLTILAYIEASRIYGSVSGDSSAGAKYAIKIYIDPLDPTTKDHTSGRASYAWNPLVFVEGVSCKNLDGVTDGTPNTIMAAQKFSRCEAINAWYAPGTSVALEGISPALFLEPDGAGTYTSANAPQVGIQPDACVPGLAATTLHGGILISVCDASVRAISAGQASSLWHSLCTPASGEVPPACW